MQVRCNLDSEESIQLEISLQMTKQKTEDGLLVDAEIAFNKLNRTATLENIKVLL